MKFLFRIYRHTISPDHGIFKRRVRTCVFWPSCSEYAEEAFEKHFFIKAFSLSVLRVARCHPWQKKHFDPVP